HNGMARPATSPQSWRAGRACASSPQDWGVGGDLVLLAENSEGYANLCRLLSEAHLTSPRLEPALALAALNDQGPRTKDQGRRSPVAPLVFRPSSLVPSGLIALCGG